VKIAICDDHSLFTEALEVLLTAEGHEVVATVDRPADLMPVLAQHAVEVCLMDLGFPDASGIDGIKATLAASPETKVVALTGSTSRVQLNQAIEAGASAFVPKGAGAGHLLEVIPQVAASRVVLRRKDLRVLTSSKAPSGRGGGAGRFLTPREREVLEHLVHGRDAAATAREMGVSYSTARTHIQNILTKLDVHSRLEAVAFAISHSIVSVDSLTAQANDGDGRHATP
jgi:two-component system, NarL family, nitrate/nitrite response regulator NarL